MTNIYQLPLNFFVFHISPKEISLILMFLLPFIMRAQKKDSIQASVGIIASASNNNYQPHWLVVNKFGTIADRQTDLSNFIYFKHTHSFLQNNKKKDSTDSPYLFAEYGALVTLNNHFADINLTEGYGKIGYGKWEIRAGRYRNITGDVNKDMSTGSLGVSGNALPIPMLTIALTEYINVPFAKGWLQFKTSLSHGWFGNNRYMKNAYYHEKSFYIRMGAKRLKFYGGVQHFGEWGGRRGDFQLERSWKGFLDVLFVKEEDDGSVGTAINGLRPSRAGDQRGVIESGFYLNNENYSLQAYAQMPVESGEEVDIRNRSVLAGLVWSSKIEETKVKKILVEFLHTKTMNQFVGNGQRQTYYNNGYYKTGWEYEGRVVGTALFWNRHRMNKYFSEVKPLEWNAPDNTIPGNSNIINNMILGFHTGMQVNVAGNFLLKTLITYTRNYGSLSDESKLFFAPHKTQIFTLQDITWSRNAARWIWNLQVGIDFGNLGTTIGGIAGCRYMLAIR
jgi:Capsule assembly protein Wzi